MNCTHTYNIIIIPGKANLTVDVMLLRYLDLRFVPVQFATCSEQCQAAVLQHYRELQTQTQANLDREYEENIKQAQKQVEKSGVAISTGVPEHRITYYTGRPYPCRQRKCSIM